MPDLDLAARSGNDLARQSGLKRCQRWQDDEHAVILSVIDCQIDFIAPNGALSVPGAIDDTDRLNQFIFKNVGSISHIVASLDTHHLFQPFHRFNWEAGSKPINRPDKTVYQTGEHPDPFTVITLHDVQQDVWRPVRYPAEMIKYLTELEQQHKKQLCIWPLHCMQGAPGQALDPAFAEALVFHSAARRNQYHLTVKGVSALSEHYGILRAEVPFAKDPSTELNQQVLSKWEEADRVYFAGQAKSHCVIETLNQTVEMFTAHNRNHLLEKMFVLQDCMSSVGDIALPDGTKIEFDKMANARLAELAQMGVKLVNSTDPIVF
jgi:nicotinamidase-related amidase